MTLLKKIYKKSFNSKETCTGKSDILLCWNSVLKIKAHSSVNESLKQSAQLVAHCISRLSSSCFTAQGGKRKKTESEITCRGTVCKD